MQAVIPAAGEGTRLRPLTEDRPKVLVEVAGEPLLTHCFEQLLDVGVEEFVVVVGYRMEDVLDRYGDEFRGVPITYVHQRDRLGLAHAVGRAESAIEDDFVLSNGDNVFRANLEEAVERQRRPGVDAALLVEEVPAERARTTGVVETDGSGRVTGLVEKPDDPPSTLVTTGCYVLPTEIFHACELLQPSGRGEYELPEAIDLLAAAGATVETVPLDGWRVNVNTSADVERAERRLGDGRECDNEPSQ